MLDPQVIYEIWAPARSVWSAWAKPVLFAHLPGTPEDLPAPDRLDDDLSWLPRPDELAALVVDLPGPEAVRLGLSLARAGVRPVPLFNACPGPLAVLDLQPVMSLLQSGASVLRQTALPAEAPPAFLLDADRMPAAKPLPGQFDNRWLTFPQDFPSATCLLSHGQREVVLVQRPSVPREDLAHVLRRWQEAGLRILLKTWGTSERLVPIEVPRPAYFRFVWQRLLAAAGLRRNAAGGFGQVVPRPGTHG